MELPHWNRCAICGKFSITINTETQDLFCQNCEHAPLVKDWDRICNEIAERVASTIPEIRRHWRE